MKWQDYSEETWIDYTAIEKKCQPWLDYKKHQKRQAHTVASIVTLAADLLAIPADILISQICKEAGIAESEVLSVCAGVPYETYSIARRTNKGRDLHKTVHGYSFRLTDTERNPCCPESSECPYADKARLHDGIVEHVLQHGKLTWGGGYGARNLKEAE